MAVKGPSALGERDAAELEHQGFSTLEPDDSRFVKHRYFCVECWAIHDFHNSWDDCAECGDGDVVLVWPSDSRNDA